jgi:hypothetical protein
MTDVQGPFSCAAQMWGIEDFLSDLHEHPNEIHHLLSLCADAIVGFFLEMYGLADGSMIPIHCPPMIWVPKDCGVAVSDDFFAVVGAETVRDYSCPYLERIGEAFGGLTVHTCGNMNHLAGLMNGMKTLRCVNFSASETDLRRYARGHDPEIMLYVHKSALSAGGLPLLDAAGHIGLCRDVQREFGVNVIANAIGADAPLTPENRRAWLDAAGL